MYIDIYLYSQVCQVFFGFCLILTWMYRTRTMEVCLFNDFADFGVN